ncbi:MAG: type II toxin-antitoxin system VapB family antitoxin [Deltaproteobacteria bacterium]|nr:type II toxin-antitoxin system VapB family antitoxin [Deltaproteobacteria bacterium]
MKTTIDIADSLLKEAREIAAKKHLTLRSLVEQGLRNIIVESDSGEKFILRKASFKGNGIRDEFRCESWNKIREAAYEDHGG